MRLQLNVYFKWLEESANIWVSIPRLVSRFCSRRAFFDSFLNLLLLVLALEEISSFLKNLVKICRLLEQSWELHSVFIKHHSSDFASHLFSCASSNIVVDCVSDHILTLIYICGSVESFHINLRKRRILRSHGLSNQRSWHGILGGGIVLVVLISADILIPWLRVVIVAVATSTLHLVPSSLRSLTTWVVILLILSSVIILTEGLRPLVVLLSAAVVLLRSVLTLRLNLTILSVALHVGVLGIVVAKFVVSKRWILLQILLMIWLGVRPVLLEVGSSTLLVIVLRLVIMSIRLYIVLAKENLLVSFLFKH
jgi:hypothetical protein